MSIQTFGREIGQNINNFIRRDNVDNRRGRENKTYKEYYREYWGMTLEELDPLFNEEGISNVLDPFVLPANEGAENEEAEEVVENAEPPVEEVQEGTAPEVGPVNGPGPIDQTPAGFQAKALRRVYGEKIIERARAGRHPQLADGTDRTPSGRIMRSIDGQKITAKQRAFLVRDMVTSGMESAVSDLFVEMHGFKSWRELMREMAVCPDEVTTNMIGEDGRIHHANLHYMRLNGEMQRGREMYSLQNIGKNIVHWGLPAVAGLLSGGGSVVFAGMAGAEISKRITRRIVHGNFVRHREGADADSTGMQIVEKMMKDYQDVIQTTLVAIQANQSVDLDPNTVTGSPMVDDFNRTGRDGVDVLGKITASFRDKASANLGGDTNLNKYWENNSQSQKWEMAMGIIGGMCAGGAMVNSTLHGSGMNIDIDKDGTKHLVKYLSGADGQDKLRWFMNQGDIPSLHQGMPLNLNLHTLGFDKLNQLYNPATMDSSIIQQLIGRGEVSGFDIFKTLLSSRDGITQVTAIAAGATLDRFFYFCTGRTKPGFQRDAENAVAALANDAQEGGRVSSEIALRNARTRTEAPPADGSGTDTSEPPPPDQPDAPETSTPDQTQDSPPPENTPSGRTQPTNEQRREAKAKRDAFESMYLQQDDLFQRQIININKWRNTPPENCDSKGLVVLRVEPTDQAELDGLIKQALDDAKGKYGGGVRLLVCVEHDNPVVKDTLKLKGEMMGNSNLGFRGNFVDDMFFVKFSAEPGSTHPSLPQMAEIMEYVENVTTYLSPN